MLVFVVTLITELPKHEINLIVKPVLMKLHCTTAIIRAKVKLAANTADKNMKNSYFLVYLYNSGKILFIGDSKIKCLRKMRHNRNRLKFSVVQRMDF